MSKIRVNDVELHYQSIGSGPETIVFVHGYMMTNHMFDKQIETFKDRFRCIAYDQRGHGQSEITEDGYELDNLVTDAIYLIEALAGGPVHYVGLSAGGMVGMRVALRRPDLLKSLVLMGAPAEAESDEALKEYNLLLTVLKYLGPWAVIGQTMPILFHDEFLNDTSRQDEVKHWRAILKGQNKKGILPFSKGIFWRESIVDQLPSISIPTAMIVGEFDNVTPPDVIQKVADAIPKTKMYSIPGSGHSAPIEKPTEVSDAMKAFYQSVGVL